MVSWDDVLKDIDQAIAPPLSQERALEALQELQEEVQDRIFALRGDIASKRGPPRSDR